MVQVILSNMQVCPGPSLPEPGAGVQIDDIGVTEWQTPESKTYASIWIGVISTGYAGSLKVV